MGKRYLPSEAQVQLYKKWTKEWGFSHEAIEAAVELTAKGDPSMGYLDGILDRLRQDNVKGDEATPEAIEQNTERTKGLRRVIHELGRGDVNNLNLELYDEMVLLYSEDIILTAARECARYGFGRSINDVLDLLKSWKKKGLNNTQEVDAYINVFHDQMALIREIRKMWGNNDRGVGSIDRNMINKWENELGFSREMIKTAAKYAVEAKQPMTYLGKILEYYKEKGINTPEKAKLDHESRKKISSKKEGKVLPAQDFAQRDYTNVQDKIMQSLAKEMEAYMHENGGESDA